MNTSNKYTAQMADVVGDYRSRLESLAIPDKILSAPFVSSVTGKALGSAAELSSGYWCQNLTSPVLFHSAITEVLSLELSNPLFLEIGPHSALSGFLSDIGQDLRLQSIQYIPTLVRDVNSYESVLRTAGRLFQSGAPIDLSSLCKGATLPDLPCYSWQYDGRFWSESRVSRNWRFREHPNHDLLGSKIPDGNDKEPIWRSLIYLDSVPWLCDHVINGRILLPRAGYISVAAQAISQLSKFPDLSMRNVHFLADLELFEKLPTELMTQLRPSKLTATRDSEWYDFDIASFFDGVWTKHCTGQVRGGRQVPIEVTFPRAGPRKVQPRVWQRATQRLGIIYGPRFNLMQDISASVTDAESTAMIKESRERRESSYAIHPCTIDSMFQLLSVANSRGLPRLFDHQVMPTYIGEVYINPVSSQFTSRAVINSNTAGSKTGSVAGFCGEQPVISMRQMQLASLGDEELSRDDPHAGARLVWKPDIDEVDVARLIRPIPGISSSILLLEELALACMIETHHQIRGIAPPLSHAAKYFDWLSIQRQRAEKGHYENVPACQTIASMASAERTNLIDSLYSKALETEARDMATAVTRIFRHSTGLFQCQVDSLSLLLKDNLLTAIYGFAQLCDFSDFFKVFAHNRPSMRILEIGAGTGGVTATILPAMRGPNGERMYDIYTYTDISSGFFDAAQKRFSGCDGITYRPLDITANPLERGFEASSYDLIIASNVLHATPCLQETLANVKVLLKPDGKLFLQELAPTTKWINFIMGTLSGWWLGAADDREWEPYISPERWDKELRTAGFSGADSVVHDGHMNAHIISSVQTDSRPGGKRVTVLCEDMTCAVDQFISCIRGRGFAADVRRPGEERPADQMIISLLELDTPQLHSENPDKYLQIRDLLASLETTPMLWVTKPSQVKCADPRYASTLGLLRTARRELAARVGTLELDSLDSGAFDAVLKVAERLLLEGSSDPSVDPVLEYAFVDGTLMVGKFYPAVVNEELLDELTPVSATSNAVTLQINGFGANALVDWRSQVLDIPALTEWVEVETRAVSLNDGDLAGIGAIRECAGIILRVGTGVTNLRVGDRVAVLAAGPIATRFITSERLCVRMARDLTWVEAATMPYAFATALYSLIDIARLKHGDVRFALSTRYTV
jgi:SAM-dependent methyltransferase